MTCYCKSKKCEQTGISVSALTVDKESSSHAVSMGTACVHFCDDMAQIN